MLNSIKEMIISILNILGEGQDRVNRMGIIIIPGNGSLCNNPIEDYQNGDEWSNDSHMACIAIQVYFYYAWFFQSVWYYLAT